jgi:hypothetical protein
MTGLNPNRAVERCERLAKLGRVPPWWRVFARRRWVAAYYEIMARDISEQAEMLRSIYTADQVQQMAHKPNPMASVLRMRVKDIATGETIVDGIEINELQYDRLRKNGARVVDPVIVSATDSARKAPR